MTAHRQPRGYAVGLLRRVELGPDIWSYMAAIEQTFARYGGEWVEAAREWYTSPEYQAILRLRTDHADSTVLLVEGVADGYRAAETIAKLRASTAHS